MQIYTTLTVFHDLRPPTCAGGGFVSLLSFFAVLWLVAQLSRFQVGQLPGGEAGDVLTALGGLELPGRVICGRDEHQR